MKSRSSTGVGQKIELEYNIETMRITDPGEDAGLANGSTRSSIYDTIKATSRVSNNDSSSEDTGKVTGDVQSNKLKQLLGQIKQG
jgi:hypothetical protein